MNVIADFHVDSSALLMSDALKAVPEMRADVEQHTANASGLPIFFFWASGGDFEAFDVALDADESVDTATVLDKANGQQLYRVEFTRPSFYPRYRQTAAKIIRIHGSAKGWSMRMRFPDQDSFREYRSYYLDEGVSFHLDRIHTKTEDPREDQFGLTPVQYETLLLAFERGYFDEPRETSLEELADALDVSTQAVAGRLRRAHRNLIENSIADDWEPDTLSDLA